MAIAIKVFYYFAIAIRQLTTNIKIFYYFAITIRQLTANI
jgi:hypothetical protein